MGMKRSSFYYVAHPPEDGPLRDAIRQMAMKYTRWGCEALTERLRQEGWKDNHKRIYRLYRKEGLQVKQRRKRKTARWRGEPLAVPEGINEVWGMDFISDQLENGRRIRSLVVLDLFSRECLAIETDTSLSGARVARVLEGLTQTRGVPKTLLSDNGPEFTCRAMDRWAYARDIKLHFIQPGKPMQNGFVEGFNSTFRDQCLNEHWFVSMSNARELIEEWRTIYNTIKPHSALGMKTPQEFSAVHSGHAQSGQHQHNPLHQQPTEVLSL
jgi:putative transposase